MTVSQGVVGMAMMLVHVIMLTLHDAAYKMFEQGLAWALWSTAARTVLQLL